MILVCPNNNLGAAKLPALFVTGVGIYSICYVDGAENYRGAFMPTDCYGDER